MKNLQQVEELLGRYTVCGEKFSYYISSEDVADCKSGTEAAEEMREELERAVQESSDIIYYSNAIEFLAENDPSLQESLELAHDLGYKTKDLNSELLASLLNYSMNMEQLSEDLEAFASDFDDLEEEEEEEEE